MTASQNYALTFPENKLVFTGEPANPPMPAIPVYCEAGKFYRLASNQVWYECLTSGYYTELSGPNFEEVTPEFD